MLICFISSQPIRFHIKTVTPTTETILMKRDATDRIKQFHKKDIAALLSTAFPCGGEHERACWGTPCSEHATSSSFFFLQLNDLKLREYYNRC